MNRLTVGGVVRRVVLVAMGLFWLIPVYLLLANAAKTDDQYGFVDVWKPVGLGGLWGNMGAAWEKGNLGAGVASTVIPIQMILMPLFRGYVKFDLYDTRVGMIIIYTVLTIPFAAFVMRNFFSGIAREIFEAAT